MIYQTVGLVILLTLALVSVFFAGFGFGVLYAIQELQAVEPEPDDEEELP